MIPSTDLKSTGTVNLKHLGFTERVILLQKESKFATCSEDRKIIIYQIENDSPLKTLTTNSHVNNIIELRNGNLVSSHKDGKVKIWNSKSYACEVTLFGHNTWTLPLLELPEDKLVSGDGDGKIKVWDLTSYKWVQDIDNEKSKNSDQVSFECRGLLLMKDNVLLCGIGNKIVAHRPLTVKKEINLMNFFVADQKVYDLQFASFEGHGKIVRMLKSLNDGVRFLSVSDDCDIKLWDLNSQNCILTFLGNQDFVSDVVYDRNNIVSGHKGGLLKFWDLNTGKVVREIKAHETNVSSIAVKSDKTLLTTHGEDPILKFWHQ